VPRANVIDPQPGGWGCTCPAWRPGEPEPGEALAALARSANVTVEVVGPNEWRCWTDPESKYRVTYDPARPGGWCKHCEACLIESAPWHRQTALGAAEALDRVHALEVENRALARKVKRLEKRGCQTK
jgi:hypothetical protein